MIKKKDKKRPYAVTSFLPTEDLAKLSISFDLFSYN